MIMRWMLFFFVFFGVAFPQVPSLEEIKNNLKKEVLGIQDDQKENLKDIKQRLENYEKVYPHEIFFSYWKVYVLEKLGEDEETLKAIDGILKEDDTVVKLYEIKGDILFKQKKYDDAITTYKRGLERTSDGSDFFLRIAKTYEFMGKYGESGDFYKRHTVLKPNDIAGYRGLIKIYALLADNVKQLDAMELGYEKTKEPLFLFYIGEFFENDDKLDKAIVFYRKYLDIRFDKGIVLRLSEVFKKKGDLLEARKLFEEGITKDHNEYLYYVQLSHVCMDMSDEECAERNFTYILTLPQSTEQSHLDLAVFYVKTQRNDNAFQTLDAALGKYPDSSLLLHYRGFLYTTLKQLDKAKEDANKLEGISKEQYDDLMEKINNIESQNVK